MAADRTADGTRVDESRTARTEEIEGSPDPTAPDSAGPPVAPGAAALAAARRLVRLGRPAQARTVFADRVKETPVDPAGWHGLGCCAVAMGGNAADRQFALADGLARSGQAAKAVTIMQATLPRVAGDPRAVSNLMLTMLFDPAHLCPWTLATDHPAFAEPAGAGGRGRRATPDAADRALRIGYLCADFRAHSNAAGVRALFEGGPRSRFRRFAYHNDRCHDATTDWFQAAADGWRDVAGLSDGDLAAAIQADGIDVLVDPAGPTAGNRLGCFALRPAPLQLPWINATGLACMDAVLTDATMVPCDAALPGEPPVRLPLGALPYRPGVALPEPVGPDAGHDGVLFGSMNNPLKLSDPLLDAWAAILNQQPCATLLLKFGTLDDPMVRRDIAERLRARDIGTNRLIFEGLTPWGDHLRRLSRVDIALDTFPGNGGVTSWETLCMGVPMVCLRGDRPNGRVGASILDGLGHGDLAATTVDEYVGLSLDLARHPHRRRDLGADLRAAALNSPLTRDGGHVGQVEEAPRALWQRQRGGSASAADRLVPTAKAVCAPTHIAGSGRRLGPDRGKALRRQTLGFAPSKAKGCEIGVGAQWDSAFPRVRDRGKR